MSKTRIDAVKHPAHYVDGRKYEPKDVIRDWSLNFNLGNAVKYIARAGRKDDIVQDLKKAQEYIQFEIDAIEAERAEATKPNKEKIPFSRNKQGAIVVEVPAGADPEDIIKAVINEIYGG